MSKRNLEFPRVVVLRRVAAAGLLIALPVAESAQPPPVLEVGKFSAARPGGALPEGWQPWILSPRKRSTEYTLVAEDGATVVKAVADNAASGLIRRIRIDAKEYPIIQWRWRAANLIAGADNRKRSKEDSPVRLYLGFEGDLAQLPFGDRVFFKMIRLASGQGLPFATISYIWENDEPRGNVIPNPNTGRIQMFVVESGPQRLNQWLSYERNVVEDYRRAFGDDPPPITGVFLMSDTDNTDGSATGWYGDIIFRKAAGK